MPREFGTDPYGIIARGAPVASRDAGAVGGIGGGMGGIRAPVGGGTLGVGLGSGAIGGRGAVAGMGYQTEIGRSANVKKKAKGGKISAVEAVHKHEKNMHKGKKPTKFAKGGSTASKRADGCATKGKTKGRMV